MCNVLLFCCDVQTPWCPCGRTIGSSKQNPDSDCLSSQSLNCTSKRSLLVAHMTETRGENEPSNHHNYTDRFYILCLYVYIYIYIHIDIPCMYDYETYITHIWFGSASSCPHHGFWCAWLLNSEGFLSDIGMLYLEMLGRLPGSEWLALLSLNIASIQYMVWSLVVNPWRHLLLWDHPIMPSSRTTFRLFKFVQECNEARTR